MKNVLRSSLVLLTFLLAACAATTPAGVGAWNINMNTPVGAMPAMLTLNADGSGAISVEGMGETQFNGVTFDGNAINFAANVEAQGQSLTLDFTGTVDGDSLTGEFGTDFGAFGVTGTRR